MINGKTVLAYIPARSGSKSIIDKNIIDIEGKPLLAYSVLAAKGSKYVDRIIITTDSQKYADIAKEYGAEAPFLRPIELCTDTAVEMDATMHLMNWIERNENKKYDIIIKLEPTCPLRISEDIDKALELMMSKNATSIVSVTKALSNPEWMNALPEDGCMKDFLNKSNETKNRQELKKYYLLDGVLFISDWDYIKNNKTWYSEKSFSYITPPERAIDIDGPLELEFVRTLIKKQKEEKNMRFLIIGLGSMGSRRIRNLKALDQQNITGYDPKEERRKAAEEKYGIKTTADIDTALKETDAIIISTPPDLHMQYCLKAAKAKKHFFVEASVVLEKEFDDVIRLSKENNIIAAPSCTMRFNESNKQIKEIVDSGKLGKILTIDYHWGLYLPYWHPWEDIRQFYVGKKITGAAREMVCFELVWINWIFGEVKNIAAFKDKLSELPVDIDDAYNILLKYDNGAAANIMIEVLSKKPLKELRVIGEDGILIWDGIECNIKVFDPETKEWDLIKEQEGIREKGYIAKETMYIEEIDNFIKAINREKAWPYSLEDDKKILQLLHAIEASADSKKHIDFNQFLDEEK